MLVINLGNIKKYLKTLDFIQPEEKIVFEELHGGVTSTIIKIIREKENLVLKQALKEFKTKDKITSSPKRNIIEQKCMDLLFYLLGSKYIPEIKFRDQNNFLFIMTCAPNGSRRWKEVLLEGTIDFNIGIKLACILAKIYNFTANNKKIQRDFNDNSLFMEGRIKPCYREIQKFIPELRNNIENIINDTLKRKEALSIIDITPKNVLINDKNFILIDFEGANYGDPSFDIGIFFAHIFLKSVYNHKIKDDYFKLINLFWNTYRKKISVLSPNAFEKRVVQHTAAMMLARIIGKLPVDYLEGKDRQIIQNTSRTIILKQVTNLNDFFKKINNNISPNLGGHV